MPSASLAPAFATPHLALNWEERRRNFVSSITALLRGPAAPREFLGDPYFRDCCVAGRGPRGALLFSLGWHAAFVLLLIPLWSVVIAVPAPRQHVQIIWYGPAGDLPLILPAAAVKPRPTGNRPQPPGANPPDRQVGADAFHPHQTILNTPMRPNHARQTLIQPATAPDPPKIVPELPNIVAWNASAPRLRIDPAELARLQPKARAASAQREVAAPEEPQVSGQQISAINLDAAEADIQRPTLPVGTLSAPRARGTPVAEEAAPDVNADDGGGLRMIALSATPAPAVPSSVPAGNLSSRVAISPEGSTPGTPSNKAGIAEAGSGPPSLSITGADKSPNRGSGSEHTMPGMTASSDVRPAAPARKAATPENATSTSLAERMRPGAKPEALLGTKRIYTLHVNMPNLTSASGSWILSFAELAPPEAQANAYTNPADLAAPEPLRKVDPKYPPELRQGHVQGEVVLYAVIRADGTVDSIQLVSGIDPALDANAMAALAQWRFQPAERKGEAVELEAIVHIPFRSEAPAF